MPDISMCRDSTCPQRAKCFRYRAMPDKHQQTYSEFCRTNDNDCDGFWDCTEYIQSRLRSIQDIEDQWWDNLTDA